MCHSIAEVATILGKSERQIRYMIKQGRLLATKREGRWVIDDDALPRTPSQEQAVQVRAARRQ